MSDYNRFAGQSLERLGALSDGVFAIAMTLIVLDIRVPATGVRDEASFLRAVGSLGPHFLTYALSFLTLGIFWVGQQAQLSHFQRADRHLTWLNLAFLATVCVMPFSTHVLGDFVTIRAAFGIYWVNILALGALLYATFTYAERAKLVAEDAPPKLGRSIRERILIAQGLYAAGAALCFINNLLSMAVIVTIQLFFAVAPHWRGRQAD